MAPQLKDIVRVPISTTQTGRYPRPVWYNYDINDRSWVEMCNRPNFLESYSDAIQAIITDHEICGLDITTDGCLRYDPRGTTIAPWDTNGLAYMGGVKRVPKKPEGNAIATTIIGKENMDAFSKITGVKRDPVNPWFWWVVEETPMVGNLELWLETFKIAKKFSRKPLKFSGPSAAMAALHAVNKAGMDDRDVYFELFRVQNKVLKEIADAGCEIIQLDYPFGMAHWAAQFTEIKRDVWSTLVDAFNEEVKDVNAHIWVHFCFGAPILYSSDAMGMKWHMAGVYPHIADCKADCMQSEAANTGGKYLDKELQAWKEFLSDRDYAVGAVTPYNGTESSEDVDRIVEKALSYVPAEKLVLTSDEGLAGNGFMTRRGAMHKMRMLSEAAARARTKLNA